MQVVMYHSRLDFDFTIKSSERDVPLCCSEFPLELGSGQIPDMTQMTQHDLQLEHQKLWLTN
jgi:hypothetical protein